MSVKFDRKIFFDTVRSSLFGGSLTQQQVDGMSFKLDVWEKAPRSDDLRWLSYPFATSYHETSKAMWPIEEFGKGKGKAYGKPDPKTGEIYYGRGDVQLTWAENYQKATKQLNLSGDDDLYQHPDQALDPLISASAMYIGMDEGWYRKDKSGKRETLGKYFNATTNDPFNAREIINGDKRTVPKWSGGISIGNLVRDYHTKFLIALETSVIKEPEEPDEPDAPEATVISIQTAPGAKLVIIVNGEEIELT